MTPFPIRAFLYTTLLNFIWINLSEVFRYFVFVMPMMQKAFPQIDGIAQMSPGILAIWGLWDTILVFVSTMICWLFLDRFGDSLKHAFLSGTLVWFSVFVLFWLGNLNMKLAPVSVLLIALPLSLFEMLVAAYLVLIGRKLWGKGTTSSFPSS